LAAVSWLFPETISEDFHSEQDEQVRKKNRRQRAVFAGHGEHDQAHAEEGETEEPSSNPLNDRGVQSALPKERIHGPTICESLGPTNIPLLEPYLVNEPWCRIIWFVVSHDILPSVRHFLTY
jgi:hypothetical protein